MEIVMTEWRVSVPGCQMQNLWFYRFYHHHFGNKIWIPCQAPFHVHLLCISCSRYGLLYIGKIERSLKIRFGEHRRAVIGNDANQPIARYLILAFTVFQLSKFEPSVPFLEATIDTKLKIWNAPHFQTWHCPPTPMLLMHVILTKADIDSTFNSYLIPYLFHIFCCSFLYICINIFCNVIYIFLYFVLTKSIWSVYFLSIDQGFFLVFKPM
jgi:hypothetical protein